MKGEGIFYITFLLFLGLFFFFRNILFILGSSSVLQDVYENVSETKLLFRFGCGCGYWRIFCVSKWPYYSMHHMNHHMNHPILLLQSVALISYSTLSTQDCT